MKMMKIGTLYEESLHKNWQWLKWTAFSICIFSYDSLWVRNASMCGKPPLMKGLTQSDSEINRRDQCSAVCPLIFRGEPGIIRGSDILSVSVSAPDTHLRWKSQTQCHVIVLWTRGTGAIQWNLSWNECGLHTAKKDRHYLSSHQEARVSFNTKSHRHAVSNWEPLKKLGTFFLKTDPLEVNLHGCVCSFTGDTQS